MSFLSKKTNFSILFHSVRYHFVLWVRAISLWRVPQQFFVSVITHVLPAADTIKDIFCKVSQFSWKILSYISFQGPIRVLYSSFPEVDMFETGITYLATFFQNYVNLEAIFFVKGKILNPYWFIHCRKCHLDNDLRYF